MTTNNSISESNTSLYIRDNNRKTVSGFFPLLKYKENLYNSCHNKFSKFLNKSHDIKLLINNKINEKISINDYIINSYNNLKENKLTPIPYINNRKLKNNLEEKELKNFQRNVVFMRRLEYTNKMYENKIKKKYKNYTSKIIVLQKIIRGYLVRKVIYQINIIKETLANFFYSIHFCIVKKFYRIFNQRIADYINKEGKYMRFINKNENGYNHNKKNVIKISQDLNNVEFNSIETKKKSDLENNINLEKYNSNKNLLEKNNKNNTNSAKKNKEKHESIIENDDYIEFSSKQSKHNYKPLNQNINSINKNSRNDLLNYQLSSISSLNKLKRTKTETIQRQFRKYLSRKGYYGKFDKRKIAIIHLIKYMIVNNVRPYILNKLRLLYKEIKEIQSTQEENYYNVSTERINILNKNYLSAINEIK